MLSSMKQSFWPWKKKKREREKRYRMHGGGEKEKRENDHRMQEATQLMNSVGLTTSKQGLRVIRKARKNLDFGL